MKHLLSPLNLLTFLLLTTAPLLMAQSSATFNGPEDATTQGNWTGHYGSDGYFIAGGGSISPSYASVSLYGDTVYPWGSASSADGPRALQVSSGASTYLPAAFVASNSFTINVDVTDGGSHNVALYLLDWDSGGQRAETISVEDAATSTVLATAVGPNTLTNLTGLTNGVWVSFTIKGNVNIVVQSTNTPYLNAAVSGIFFDPPASSLAAQTITFSSIGTQTGGTSLSLGATATSGLQVTYTSSPSSVCNISGTTASFTAAGGTCSITAMQTGNSSYAAAPSVTRSFTVNAYSGGSTSPPGAYKADTTTQGNWIGNYGGDGYQVPAPGTTMLPSYASVSISGAATYSFPAETNDARALETSLGNFLPSMYYASSFTMNVGISDNHSHRVALYLLDWETGGQRAEQITIRANDGSWQDTETFQNFSAGTWAVWTVQGSFSIQVASTNLPYLNAAVSGIFFDTVSSGSPAAQSITFGPISAQTANSSLTLSATATSGLPVSYTASPGTVCGISGSTVSFTAAGGTCTITALQPGNGSYAAANPVSQNVTVNAISSGGTSSATYNTTNDLTTQGNWTNVYGGDGYFIAGGGSSNPSYASVSLYGDSVYPWNQASSANGPRALQISPGANSYLPAAFISSSSFTINVNINDGNAHTVALYLLDWDSNGQRSESISVEDAASGALLATSPNTGANGGPGPQEFSGFQNGVWVLYTIKGNVNIVVASTNGYLNAVVSGIFFSAASSSTPISSPTPAPLDPTKPQVSVFLSSGQWLSENLSGSATATVSGSAGVSALGDYDGDGLVDAVSCLNGTFQVTLSNSRSSTFNEYIGNPGDIPEPGDYDGDGKTDFSVFRPSTGVWYYLPSRTNGPIVGVQTQAESTDTPTPGDFDGDGKTDFAYFRPSTATFYVILSTNPGVTTPLLFGIPGDVPAVGDYDGDAKTDFAIYRPSTGYWYYRQSTNPNAADIPQASQGQSSDIAVPGDYDRDGKTDFALWRPSTQTWYVILSSNPGTTVVLPLGGTSPVTATPVSLTPFAAYPGVSLSNHKAPVSAPPPAATPHIDSLSLTQGPAQVGFLINGSNFGASKGTSTVMLGGTPLIVVPTTALPTGWSATQIAVQVPAMAANQTSNVTVTVAGQASNGSAFMVTNPFGCSN